jgi:hypothetical protein
MQVSRHWRLKKQRYNLENMPMPGGDLAPAAQEASTMSANGNGAGVVTLQVERTREGAVLNHAGEVYSYTVVTDAPAEFGEQAPYVLAMVRLDDGHLITTQLTDLGEEPQIGMRVEMVTRKVRTDGNAGMIVYGYKFRPMLRS